MKIRKAATLMAKIVYGRITPLLKVSLQQSVALAYIFNV